MVESYINMSLYSSEGTDNIIHIFSLSKIMKRGKQCTVNAVLFLQPLIAVT